MATKLKATISLNGDKVTVREMYSLVDQKIEAVNVSIQRLENKFDTLEAGRLSRVESNVAQLTGRVYATAGIIAFLISVIIEVISLVLKNK